MDKYEEYLCHKLNQIDGFHYENIKRLEKCPAETADLVLKTLIEWACQSQNEANIMLGRKKILEINGGWLRLHIVECARNCLDLSDEWEYRRFLELIVLAAPELKASALALGEDSENSEIREAADDFRD